MVIPLSPSLSAAPAKAAKAAKQPAKKKVKVEEHVEKVKTKEQHVEPSPFMEESMKKYAKVIIDLVDRHLQIHTLNRDETITARTHRFLVGDLQYRPGYETWARCPADWQDLHYKTLQLQTDYYPDDENETEVAMVKMITNTFAQIIEYGMGRKKWNADIQVWIDVPIGKDAPYRRMQCRCWLLMILR